MNYLTNLYRYKAEQLQEQVKLLEAKLKALEEAVVLPGPVSRETRRFEDSMVDRPRTVPVGYKNPTEAPELLARDPNVPTPPAKGSPAPVAGGSRSTQSAPKSNSMMSPFSSAPQRTPTEIVSDIPSQPDWLASATAPLTLPGSQPTTKAQFSSDVLAATKNLLVNMNRRKKEAEESGPGQDLGSLGMSQAQVDAANQAQSGVFGGRKQSTPAQQTNASPSFDPLAGLRQKMADVAQQQANVSTATPQPSAPAQKPGFHANGKPMVQRTSDPNVSTYEAGGYAATTPPPPMGKIQLGQDQSEWAKRQLEQEVGFSTKGKGLQTLPPSATGETISQLPAALGASLLGAVETGLNALGLRGNAQTFKIGREDIERRMANSANEKPNLSGGAERLDQVLTGLGSYGDILRMTNPAFQRNELAKLKSDTSDAAMKRYREEEQEMIRRFQKP